MNKVRKSLALALTAIVTCFPCVIHAAPAASSLVGLDTNGDLFQIDTKTGVLTAIASEPLHSFTLGGFARLKDQIYYVGAPSGASENALYSYNLKTSVLSHIDLDRSDDVRALFLNGKKLYGIFYDGNLGSVGVYQINPLTGATTLVVDLASFNAEPIGGGLARLDKQFYLLMKPNADSTSRLLVKFKLKANSALSMVVANKEGAAVLCDRLQPNTAKNSFVCLASPSTTQVDVCKLTAGAKATCSATLSGIERIAGGATFNTADEKAYYAFVYALGESNNQRLLKITPRGSIKLNLTTDRLIIGARFSGVSTVGLSVSSESAEKK